MKALFKISIVCIGFALVLSSCCNPSQPGKPEIATPDGYDLLRHRSLDIDVDRFTIGLLHCRNDSNQPFFNDYPMVFMDSTSAAFRKCTYDYLKNIDFSKESVIAADLGGISNVVYANMNYKIFISHKKKEILIRSLVVGTGECSGCCLTSPQYYRVVAIPRIPAGYTVRVAANSK